MRLSELIQLLEAVKAKHGGHLAVYSQDPSVPIYWHDKDFSVKVKLNEGDGDPRSCHIFAGPEGTRFKGWRSPTYPVRHETFKISSPIGEKTTILISEELV